MNVKHTKDLKPSSERLAGSSQGDGKDSFPPFDYEPRWIGFRSWIALLGLEGQLPGETGRNVVPLLLDDGSGNQEPCRIPRNKGVHLKNVSGSELMNITLHAGPSLMEVFSSAGLPPGKLFPLELLKVGKYRLHYTLAYSQETVRRVIEVHEPGPASSSSLPPNFDPHLKPRWER